MPVAAVIAVFSLVIGLVVLFLVAYTVYEQVKSLGRTVARASERLGSASPPTVRSGSEPDRDLEIDYDADYDADFG